MTTPQHPPPPWRDLARAAPHLTSKGRCSECHVHAMPAADGDMRICPVCYAVLWHRNTEEAERRRAEAARERAERIERARLTRLEASNAREAAREEQEAKDDKPK